MPDGDSALVVVRRNVEAKFSMLNAWDLRWEFEQLRRIVRRDHRWRVELYRGVASDPGRTPSEAASQVWICRDHAAAASFGGTLAEHLRRAGDESPLPQP